MLSRSSVDLGYPDSCAKMIKLVKPTAVINAAAFTNVDRAETEEELARIINGESPGVMARACQELGIPFVHLSTDYVFDGEGEAEWRTDDSPAPLNAYGRSKLQGEEAIASTGATYAIIRTSWVFSQYGKNFLTSMLRLSQNSSVISVVDDQIGGPTPAEDIARACINVSEQLQAQPEKRGVYHFSGMPAVSWCQFAREIFDQAEKDVEVRPIATSAYPTTAKRPLNSRLECSETESTFGLSSPDWRARIGDIIKDLKVSNENA